MHPPLDRLRPGVAGPEERAHLRQCSRCRVEARLLARTRPTRPIRTPGFIGQDSTFPGLTEHELLPDRTRVGGYELDGFLGAGGMAVVYRANKSGESFAIKLLTSTTREVRLRLLQEGRAQTSLNHPNVVGVLAVVEHDGMPGLVMEYVAGPVLACLSFPLPPDQVHAIGHDIFAAVSAAHALGLVHRDLKPGNILLDLSDGVRARVADFGLAKVLDGDSPVQTKTRAVLGTPAYMAPEQTQDSGDVDARTDVFALGVILYELLAGERPFRGGNHAKLFAAIQSGEHRSIHEAAPGAPAAMRDSVEKALSVDPTGRFESVAAFAAAWGAPADSAWTHEVREAMSAKTEVAELPRARPLEPESGLRARLFDTAAKLALGIPRWFSPRQTQTIEQATTEDGVRIAYSRTGTGPVVIYVLGWATHLEEGITSPLYDRDQIIRDMSRDFTWVRFDGRGAGLSERDVGPMSLDTRVLDLQAVVDAIGTEKVSLVGYSAGVPTSIAYADRHPERVHKLVLTSGMLEPRRNWDVELDIEAHTMLPLLHQHWDKPHSAYRTWLVSRIDPFASPLEVRVMAEFLRVAMNADDFAAFMASDVDFDVAEAAGRLRAPALVLHNTEDPLYPPERGGEAITAAIEGARLELISSNRHVLSAAHDKRAFARTWRLIRSFLG